MTILQSKRTKSRYYW